MYRKLFNIMANIAQIKAQLGVETLPLYRALDENNAPTEWLYNWDDTNRVRTVIHQDLMEDILNSNELYLKTSTETAQSSGKDYTLHIICKARQAAEVVI